MGGLGSKQVHELEAEYGMKIALRHWTRLKEYRDYSDYSLQVSLYHWSDVGDLIRVRQLLKEMKKRALKRADDIIREKSMLILQQQGSELPSSPPVRDTILPPPPPSIRSLSIAGIPQSFTSSIQIRDDEEKKYPDDDEDSKYIPLDASGDPLPPAFPVLIPAKEVEDIQKECIRSTFENLCRIPFQVAISAGRQEILDEFLAQGMDIYPNEYSSFVKHPIHYCRKPDTIEYLIHNGVDVYDSSSSGSSTNAQELQKAFVHFAGDGTGDHPLLQHLFQRYASISPATAMELLNSALNLITRTYYSSYLEKLVYYGIDMKVENDLQIQRLDRDPLAREFIKIYLGILEMEEPESSYDATIQTKRYREKYPVIRRLFASGFLRSSFLRTRIEPLFQGDNPPIELVIRAAMIGHRRIAQEMSDVRNVLLEYEIVQDFNGNNAGEEEEAEAKYENEQHHHLLLQLQSQQHNQLRIVQTLPLDVANVILEFWFGYV